MFQLQKPEVKNIFHQKQKKAKKPSKLQIQTGGQACLLIDSSWPKACISENLVAYP